MIVSFDLSESSNKSPELLLHDPATLEHMLALLPFKFPASGKYEALLYGKLRERAVCGEFCVLIGYPSGQDGAILPARDCPFRSRKQNVAKVQASARKFSFAEIVFCQGKKIFCVFSVFMERQRE